MTSAAQGRPRPGSAARRLAATLVQPAWLAGHLGVVAVSITMVLLGRWQLTVSDDKHFNLQNFGYALQWWAFTAAVLFFWSRVLRDHVRPPASQPTTAVAVSERRRELRDPTTTWIVPSTGQGEVAVDEAEPTPFLGYVIPDSNRTVGRGSGDAYNASYNDYLWELALGDEAAAREEERKSTPPAAPGLTAGRPARGVTSGEPADRRRPDPPDRRELGPGPT